MIDIKDFVWTRAPQKYYVSDNKITIITQPHTDLWQRTYYKFRNDNAPLLQTSSSEKYFSFEVKTQFKSNARFDQCGIAVYLNSENWIKASIEYENGLCQHLGSVVTNNGFSDWATTEISPDIDTMWYRLSRRENDFKIECSTDGITYKQMRICHLFNAKEKINFGIYACSPENSSFEAVFTNMNITECKWQAHDGQQPDKDI